MEREIEVEFRLLNGKIIRKNRELRPSQMNIGDLVSQIEEEPIGVFAIRHISRRRIVVEQIDCDPIHWRGENGRAKGPGEDCRRKNCEYYNNCPISAHIMMMSDIE